MLSVLIGCVSGAEAQQCFSPGSFFIAGHTFSCGPATTCIDPSISDLGRAAPGAGISLHPNLNNYPAGVIGFVFAHECAHFQGNMVEHLADAWAIRIGRNQGWINLLTVQQICGSVYFSPGDWTHFPGPTRCSLMIQAFNAP